jgi:hypothetical protein
MGIMSDSQVKDATQDKEAKIFTMVAGVLMVVMIFVGLLTLFGVIR